MYDGFNTGNYSGLANNLGYARVGLIKAMFLGEYQCNDEILVREGLNKKELDFKWGDISNTTQGVNVVRSNADRVYLRNPKIQANNVQ